MKYIVMECHLSYAVVLDEEGRFLKVANRQYKIGQTVTNIIEMQIPQTTSPKKKVNKWMYSIVAMAACLMLIATVTLQMDRTTYASVYMTINPEVRIDVNKNDIVVDLNGVNDDGKHLIQNYYFRKKPLDTVMNELAERAIDMGYLHEGGQISLVLDADNDEWVVSHSNTLTAHLNEHLNEKISVTIEVTDESKNHEPIIIPVGPAEDTPDESNDSGNTPPAQDSSAPKSNSSGYEDVDDDDWEHDSNDDDWEHDSDDDDSDDDDDDD